MNLGTFFDRGGSPLTGKIPVQLRVSGRGELSAVYGEADSMLQAFLNDVRLSLAQDHRKSVRLSGGTTMRMHHSYGTTKIELILNTLPIAEEEPDDDFYGGVVVELRYFLDESNPVGATAVVPESQNSGKTGSLLGRPAVPGTEPDDETTHVIIQVAKDRTLGGNPVKSGVVRIFRIKDPLVGKYLEINSTPKKYLVSANDTFTEFYLCGRLLTLVPALPLTVDELLLLGANQPGEVCIRSVGFNPRKFEAAASAGGVLIVSIFEKLWVLDTANRPPEGAPTWQLLATAAPVTHQNAFGISFVNTKLSDGGWTLVCSGSNGAGVCSGFSVTLHPGTPAMLSGTLNLMSDGTVPQGDPAVSYTSTLDLSGETTGLPYGAVGGIDFQVLRFGDISRTEAATHASPEGTYSVDRLTGDANPRMPASSSTLSVTFDTATANLGSVVDPVGGGTFPTMYFTDTYERTTTSVCGTTSRTFTQNLFYELQYTTSGNSSFPLTPADAGDGGAGTATAVSASNVVRDPNPVTRMTRYTDCHTEQMAWYSDKWRTAESTGTQEWSTVLAPPAGPFSFSYDTEAPATVAETITTSPLNWSLKLRRRATDVLHEWADVWDRIGTIPTWGQEQIDTAGGGPLDLTFGDRAGGAVVTTGAPYTGRWFAGVEFTPWTHYFGTDENFADGVPVIPPEDPGELTVGTRAYSWSLSVSSLTPSLLTMADYADLVSWAFWTSWTGVRSYNPVPYLQLSIPSAPSAQTDAVGYELFAAPRLPSGGEGTYIEENMVQIDLRTRGFVAESYVAAGEMGAPVGAVDAFVGNDVATALLRPILDQWFALGALSGVMDGKHVHLVKTTVLTSQI